MKFDIKLFSVRSKICQNAREIVAVFHGINDFDISVMTEIPAETVLKNHIDHTFWSSLFKDLTLVLKLHCSCETNSHENIKFSLLSKISFIPGLVKLNFKDWWRAILSCDFFLSELSESTICFHDETIGIELELVSCCKI